MANVIVLKAWREQHPGKVPARAPHTAPVKVLIYTGVRYERREVNNHRSMDLAPVRAEQN